ncbi:capsular biosynthesis protein, partial [Methylobacterium radiotolerans]
MAESRVSLRVIAGSLRKFWWLIVLCGVVGAAGSYGYASLQTPLFQATTSLYFALNQGTSASDLNQGSVYTQSQMLSFAQLATSSRVLDPV